MSWIEDRMYDEGWDDRAPECPECGTAIVFLYNQNRKQVPVEDDKTTIGCTIFDPKLGHVLHFANTCPRMGTPKVIRDFEEYKP